MLTLCLGVMWNRLEGYVLCLFVLFKRSFKTEKRYNETNKTNPHPNQNTKTTQCKKYLLLQHHPTVTLARARFNFTSQAAIARKGQTAEAAAAVKQQFSLCDWISWFNELWLQMQRLRLDLQHEASVRGSELWTAIRAMGTGSETVAL